MRSSYMVKSSSIAKLEENLDQLKKKCFKNQQQLQRQNLKRKLSNNDIFQPIRNQDHQRKTICQQVVKELLQSDESKYLTDWVEQIYVKNFDLCLKKLSQKKLKEDEIIAQVCKDILDNLYEIMRNLKSKIGDNEQKLHYCLKKINNQSRKILERCLIWYPKSRNCQGIQRLKTFIKKDSFTFHQPQKYFPTYTDIQFEKSRSIRVQLMKTLDFMMRGLDYIVPQYSNYQISSYAVICCMMGQIFRSAGSIDFDKAFLQELQLFTLPKDRPIDPAIFLKMVSPSEQSEKSGSKQDPMYSSLAKITPVRRTPANPKLFSQENRKGGVFQPVQPSLVNLMENWIQQLQKNLNDWANDPEKINNTLKPIVSPTSPVFSPATTQTPFQMQKNAAFRLNKKDVQIVNKFAKQQKAKLDKYLQNLKKDWEKDYINRTTQQPKKKIYKYLNDEHVSILSTEITKLKGYYLFDYLTELIRSLQQILQKSKDQIQEKKDSNIGNLNLITFQIFDLISYTIEGDQDYLLTIYKYLRALHNRFPIGLSFLKFQDRTATQYNDLVLTVFLCNKYSLKILLKLAPQANITDNSGNNCLNKFIQGLLKSNDQFGMIPHLTTILCNFDRRTANVYRNDKNLYRVKLQYPRQQFQKIKFCTLNLSKICQNPFLFHEYEKRNEKKSFSSKNSNKKQLANTERIDDEFKELFKKVVNQDKKNEKKVTQFQWNNIGNFSKHPEYRYSIIHNRKLGILQNGRLMNHIKFYQEWEKVYNQNKDKIGHISQEQKRDVRYFDRICYQLVYNNSCNIHMQHSLHQTAKPLDNRNYCNYLERLYNKPFVNQNIKYDKLVQFIDRYDIVFLQECSQNIYNKLKNNVNFSIYGKKNCFILITSKYLQTREVQVQKREKNNGQIVIIQLDKQYILVCSQIDNVHFKGKQFNEILQNLQKKNQNKIIIGGYNITSLDVKIQVNQQFEQFPRPEQDTPYTIMQKKTYFNMMPKLQIRQLRQKRDFLLCYGEKMDKKDIVTAKNEQTIGSSDMYLPSDHHPFNHLIVEAQITKKMQKAKL